MKSINSVSGGKSSAYMALHYPADVYLFAAVLTNDPACVIKDTTLRNYAESKIPWFDWGAGGCREVDLTLLNLMKLEQEMGQELEWVAAPFTFDDLVLGRVSSCTFGRPKNSPLLPNKRMRFCTQALKLYPIFWRCYLYGDGDPVFMNIGFRWDEERRLAKWSCKNDNLSVPLHCDIVGQFKKRHRHTAIEWRIVSFPLYQARVDNWEIKKFWSQKGWDWPEVSNCDFCFFHRQSQHQAQARIYPERVAWWQEMEEKVGATWGTEPLDDILNPAQMSLFDFDFDSGSGCLCGD